MKLLKLGFAIVSVISALSFFRDQAIEARAQKSGLNDLFRDIANQPRFPRVEPEYLKAIAKRESNFDPMASRTEEQLEGSPKSHGLMQILCPQELPALSQYGVKWPPEDCSRLKEDLRYNITVGAAILDHNIKRKGDLETGIATYNDAFPHSETPDQPIFDNEIYVNDVMRYIQQYRKEF